MIIRIAGHTLGFDNRLDLTAELCRDYLSDGPADAVIEVTDLDIANIRGTCLPAEREFYALHQKVLKHMLANGVLPFHGSCLAIDSQAILFTAASGVGKSTHARLWRERFGDRVVMINDDKPLLQYHPDSNSWTAWGSPWSGKERINTNIGVPLKSIVALYQAQDNSIKRLTEQEALSHFLMQAYTPADDMALWVKALKLIESLTTIPTFELGCNISQEAVTCSYTTLQK